MRYRDFKKGSIKGSDAWVEILIFDTLSTPLAYLICLCSTHRFLPYIITLLSFLTRVSGAWMIATTQFIHGAAFVFLSCLLDGIDGKTSRHIFKEDPESRGTMDFLLDQVAFTCLFIALFWVLRNNTGHFLWLMSYVALSFIFASIISTKFRLFALKNHNPSTHLLSTVGKNLTLLNKLKEGFGRYNLIFHPSSMEAYVLVFIVYPLFPQIEILMLAVACLFVDIVISGLGPLYLLIRQ